MVCEVIKIRFSDACIELPSNLCVQALAGSLFSPLCCCFGLLRSSRSVEDR